MNDSRNGTLIRNQYVPAFRAIKDEYGWEYSGWKIDPDVSLRKAISYTELYVVEHKTPHFRYKYYKDVLREAIRNLHFNTTNGSILCVDMGCGPSLFSWVVRDYIYSSNENILMIGYDHAKKMILLSKKFHEYFVNKCAIKYDWYGYYKIDHLEHYLENQDLSGHDIIITLGHVLIQIKDNKRAMCEFSKVIRILCLAKSCIVVAVDAYTGEWRQAFQDGWKGFQKALCEAGVDCGPVYLNPGRRSYVYARLDGRG